ncbi:MAG TPA: hypothetical protein DIC56_04685 [Rhizobium sp.]|nr:hypothetical protein [Rhizobium sp.]
MDELPQPTKSARNVLALTGAICSELLPGFSVLRELYGVYLESKIEQHQRELIQAIEARGISAQRELSDEQSQFLLPAAYRFFEQVRLGEYAYNLKILAAFIAESVVREPGTLEAGDVGRFARQLEYLDLKTLKVMAAALMLRDKLDVDETFDFVSSEGLKHHFPELFQDTSLHSVRSSLAVLSSRGLLGPDGSPQLGKTEETYFVTPDGYALSKLLRQQRATQYDDQS